MLSQIIFIGVSQSAFISVLMFIKKSLSIADKILGCWLVSIAMLFMVNIFKLQAEVPRSFQLWPFSLTLLLAFPQFLYLYAKYISTQYRKFDKREFLHFLPSFILLLIIIILYDHNISNLLDLAIYYDNFSIIESIFGIVMQINVWIYTFMACRKIYLYKKQKSNIYSFDSTSVNLNWLYVVIIFFFIYFHVMLIASSVDQFISVVKNLEYFRSGSLLVFVYVVSFWGIKQQQLMSINKPVSLNKVLTLKTNNSDRYQKSGLREENAKDYLQQLVNYMKVSEPWKDNKLSLAKLSEQTNIPKHHITQILNEYLNKNFYTFINEYRTEYAKQLILSSKSEKWSFISIAYECGFNSKTAFNSFFKKYTTMTPSEFKNSKMKK